MYLNFAEVKALIEPVLISIEGGLSQELPSYEDLYDLTDYATTKDEIKYISLLYYSLKELTNIWYNTTYHFYQAGKNKIKVIENRDYKNDPRKYKPKILSVPKDVYLNYKKREIEDQTGNPIVIIEDTFESFPNIVKYGTVQLYLKSKNNLFRIKNNLDLLFKKRNPDIPKRSFVYFIEWIKAQKDQPEIKLSHLRDKSELLSPPSNKKNKPRFLFDLWTHKDGRNHYNEVIDYLKTENIYSGNVFLTVADNSLKWNALLKYLQGFWFVCKEENFVNWDLSSKLISEILSRTFSTSPPSKYFEPEYLKNINRKKFVSPFEALPGTKKVTK